MKEGVQNSSLFVAIVSGPCLNKNHPHEPPERNAYFSRDYCLKEMHWAVEAGIPIQPVALAEDAQSIDRLLAMAPCGLRTSLENSDWLRVSSSSDNKVAVIHRILAMGPSRRRHHH